MIRLLILHLIVFSVDSIIPLRKLHEKRARCLDGSVSGYYLEKAVDPSTELKWVLYLNGGGECDSKEGCYSHLQSELGSSDYFKSNYSDSSSWYFASGYCPYNPSFCTWNHVNVPYCSQDLHSGTREEATAETWDLFFAGHLIIESILDELDHMGLEKATDIILTGVSAGGLGTYMNIDYIKDRYPNARVTAATIAGYYFYATYYEGTNHTNPEDNIADFTTDGMVNLYELYQSYVDESCAKAMQSSSMHPSACMMANYSLPYLKSDIFAVQSLTDKVVLTGHEGMVITDDEGNLQHLQYNPRKALKRLLCTADFHVGSQISILLQHRLLSLPTLPEEFARKPARQRQKSSSKLSSAAPFGARLEKAFANRSCLLAGTLDGGLLLVTN